MVLYINACARANSRTKRLVYALIKDMEDYVTQLDLYDMDLPLLDEPALIEREYAAEREDDSNPFVALAKEFRDAEAIVIGAPYWDLGYPAILRSYLEAIMTCGITFDYDDDGNIMGLCKAKELFFVTTSGGIIEKPNLGYAHIKALATKMLGITRCFCFAAEGLDMENIDADSVLESKIKELEGITDLQYQTHESKNTIMVVDDSKVNILKAEHILKEYGYATLTAESGMDCIKQLKLKHVDLILLDIEMPEMNGFETVDLLRGDSRTANIPVIFVTSDKSTDIVIKASQKKIAGYITKPFDEDELLNHVRKTLTAHKREL